MLFVRFKPRVFNKGGHFLCLRAIWFMYQFKTNYFQVPIANNLYFKKPKRSFSL
jgi:hypothetical protein